MNRKDAKEIVAGSVQSKDSVLDRAEGFLEADAQWKERVKPLVEALESGWQIEDCFQVPTLLGASGSAVIRKAIDRFRELTPKALSDFKREVEE